MQGREFPIEIPPPSAPFALAKNYATTYILKYLLHTTFDYDIKT